MVSNRLGLAGIIGGLGLGLSFMFGGEPSNVNERAQALVSSPESKSEQFDFQEIDGNKFYSIHKGVYSVVEESLDGKSGTFLGFFRADGEVIFSQFKSKDELLVKTEVDMDYVRTPEKIPADVKIDILDSSKSSKDLYFRVEDGRKLYRIAPGNYDISEERRDPHICASLGFRNVSKYLRFEEIRTVDSQKYRFKELYFKKSHSADADKSKNKSSVQRIDNPDGSFDNDVTVRDLEGNVVDRYIEHSLKK